MSVELGSFWLIKDSGCIAIVRSIVGKSDGGLTVVYNVTDNSGASSYRMSCEYELFTNIAEKLITKSELKDELNTEYVKGKTDGYNEGYQHGFTLAKEKGEKDNKRVYNDGYVKGHNDGWHGAVKAYSFGKPNNEVVDKLDKEHEEGYNKGYTQCIEDNSQRNKSEFVEVRQHHYDMGYNDALAYLASEEAEKELELKKQGYEEGYDGGFEDGYNTAIKEMKVDKFNSGVCGYNVPNKETQEAMQEVLNKGENEFAGIWVAKDGSGKLKVLSLNEGTCDVELVEHVSNSYLCVGDTATISIDDLKEHWTQEELVNKEAKHNHYRKSVEHLDYIDIYRVCKLFKVKDDSHCLHHSIKKLLMSGQRGAGKSKIQDITEARDSLNSYLENEELFKGYSDD